MSWRNLNIEEKLREGREVPTTNELNNFLEEIWVDQHLSDVSILSRLKEKPSNIVSNRFDSSKLDQDCIFHIDDIEKICVNYRLRFLSSHYFKGDIPQEAISKVKDLERVHNTSYRGFKIMAPSKLFKLSNADDPLLFIPIKKDYYYFVHKWGNDLAWYRKAWAWCFKSFENLAVLCLGVSLLVTLLIPDGMFFPAQNATMGFFLEFLFMFKSVVAIVIYYAFMKGKNFNTAIWNSKYFNA